MMAPIWRRLLWLVTLATIISAGAIVHARQHGQSARQDSSSIKLATELVSLNVAVTDRSGRAITGLTKKDFKVYENGVEQPISFFSADESPASWGLVLDRSRSMDGMIQDVYQMALHAIDQGTEEDEMFIVTFNEQAELVCDFTSDRHKLESAIRGLRAQGETALYDAIALALDPVSFRPIAWAMRLIITTTWLTLGFESGHSPSAACVTSLLNQSYG